MGSSDRCYLFLDVDGVLNSTVWMHKRFAEKGSTLRSPHDHLDPEAMVRLNHIIEETGCKVVVSSTWRCGRSIEELQALLDLHGFKGDIVGKTCHGFNGERGLQIRQWLREVNEDDATFVALDDSIGDMDAVLDRLVRTSLKVGLTDADADRVVAMLRGGI